MTDIEWTELLQRLLRQAEIVQAWPEDEPDTGALRCEQSRHRTLGHLRACQEQWLVVLRAFLAEAEPKLTILHPWRHFEAQHYELASWADHLRHYESDRKEWLALVAEAERSRCGTWNRKPDSVEGLTARLAAHEQHHIALLA